MDLNLLTHNIRQYTVVSMCQIKQLLVSSYTKLYSISFLGNNFKAVFILDGTCFLCSIQYKRFSSWRSHYIATSKGNTLWYLCNLFYMATQMITQVVFSQGRRVLEQLEISWESSIMYISQGRRVLEQLGISVPSHTQYHFTHWKHVLLTDKSCMTLHRKDRHPCVYQHCG
jgi:hypothetical protein